MTLTSIALVYSFSMFRVLFAYSDTLVSSCLGLALAWKSQSKICHQKRVCLNYTLFTSASQLRRGTEIAMEIGKRSLGSIARVLN